MVTRVYVAASLGDRAAAAGLVAALVDTLGADRVVVGGSGLGPGRPSRDAMSGHVGAGPSIDPGEGTTPGGDVALEDADLVLAVIGPGWGRDPRAAGETAMRAELDVALAARCPLVVALVEGADPPEPSLLPADLVDLVDQPTLVVRPEPELRRDVVRLSEFVIPRRVGPPRSRSLGGGPGDALDELGLVDPAWHPIVVDPDAWNLAQDMRALAAERRRLQEEEERRQTEIRSARRHAVLLLPLLGVAFFPVLWSIAAVVGIAWLVLLAATLRYVFSWT